MARRMMGDDKDKNSDEVLKEHIEKLGHELGRFYNQLWNEYNWLKIKWEEYRELFGTSQERIDLLNTAAPTFFKIVHDTLWDEILLSLARLTDRPKSCGKSNLTVNALLMSPRFLRRIEV